MTYLIKILTNILLLTQEKKVHISIDKIRNAYSIKLFNRYDILMYNEYDILIIYLLMGRYHVI